MSEWVSKMITLYCIRECSSTLTGFEQTIPFQAFIIQDWSKYIDHYVINNSNTSGNSYMAEVISAND